MIRRQRNTPYDRMVYRVRILPSQLETARRRVAMLEKEALELGLRDLVQS